ncbi:hypothetical protein ABH930_001522 [Kitasatospora sp. GAS204A]|uniref:hypothetical protein n=1 Tax=unclassified Kitasatospora TaxID=2633591 RepID=UPI0024750B4F|nr:hypothetical protein [Kitasatospora sp. GAS204B]MDH6118522.1 hypothetical protein [Kitasatospora sp. GAS204B]
MNNSRFHDQAAIGADVEMPDALGMADLAEPLPQPAIGLPLVDGVLTDDQQRSGCVGCGAESAPHLGESRTTRVAAGVVRDERVRRCTPCQCKHRSGHAGVAA